ncbi:MAG: hypothetical protein AAGD38_13070 [Acidobacteriota bacterium]
MKHPPHLLRVEAPASAFAPVVAAATTADVRVGWLDFEPASTPVELAPAADLGVLRAVAVGDGRTVAVKPMKGPPVLRDVLREHFRGCVLVLVRGAIDAPRLESLGDDRWRIHRLDAPYLDVDLESLIARLRKPRPWDR